MNQMIKALLSLMALTTLAACSGSVSHEGNGGTDMSAGTLDELITSAAAKPDNADLSGTPENSPPRLDACPFAEAISTPDTAGCLAGTYTGIDAFTSEACTIRITAHGTAEASRGTVSILLDASDRVSDFTKEAHVTTKASLSPLGYSINWMATQSEENGSDKKLLFNFNEQHDEKLTIEVHHQHLSLSEMTSIICNIEH